MPELSDPPEAPEPGSGTGVKPRELVNHSVVLLPMRIRTAHDKKKDEFFDVVDCHFWLLESTGVAEEGETGISWWRAREQLRDQMGQYIACKPKQQDDNSITLERLTGPAREVAAKVIAGLALPVDEVPPDDHERPDPLYDEGTEPF
jgi:hypothetical protein